MATNPYSEIRLVIKSIETPYIDMFCSLYSQGYNSYFRVDQTWDYPFVENLMIVPMKNLRMEPWDLNCS
jgi:hypothetical protein